MTAAFLCQVVVWPAQPSFRVGRIPACAGMTVVDVGMTVEVKPLNRKPGAREIAACAGMTVVGVGMTVEVKPLLTTGGAGS